MAFNSPISGSFSWKLVVCTLIFINVFHMTNAFIYTQPRYNQRMPRRYHQPQQQYYGQPRRRQEYRRQYSDEPNQKEIVKDLDGSIELYVPCGRYCHYYEARLIPKHIGYPRNQQTIKITGPRYEKSWDVPRNVDTDGITKSILRSRYLKLVFPKLISHEEHSNPDNYEIPHYTTYDNRGNNKFQNFNYEEEEEVKQNSNNDDQREKTTRRGRSASSHRQQKRSHNNYHDENYYGGKHNYGRNYHARRSSSYNDKYNNEKHQRRQEMYENVHDEIASTKSKSPKSSPSSCEQQQQQQEHDDPYFYAPSDGIEIIDVDANEIENELYQKDRKASIGFWNSRGKFQFY